MDELGEGCGSAHGEASEEEATVEGPCAQR